MRRPLVQLSFENYEDTFTLLQNKTLKMLFVTSKAIFYTENETPPSINSLPGYLFFLPIIFHAVGISFENGPPRLLTEDNVILDVLLELDVGYSRVFGLVDHHRLPRGFNIMVHSEVGRTAVHQHSLVRRHRRKFIMSFTEKEMVNSFPLEDGSNACSCKLISNRLSKKKL